MKQKFNILIAMLLLNFSLAIASSDNNNEDDNDNISTYVIGGNESGEGDWPWMVYVHFSGGGFCGGSLIDAITVLTAAHCVSNISPDDIWVIIGGYDVSDAAISDSDNKRFVASTHIHNDYSRNNLINDIAMLRLKSPFTAITPLDRSDSNTTNNAIANEDDVTAIGWGSTVGKTGYASILQEANLPLNRDITCETRLGDLYDTNKLCAGGAAGGISSCYGDSGGPLIYNNGGNWEQIGITSFVADNECNSTSGYTRVSTFQGWIDNWLTGITIDNTLTTFTGVPTNSSQTQDLFITNNEDTQVTLTFSSTGDNVFTFEDSRCEVIEAHTSCALAVTYAPVDKGANNALLTIDSNLENAAPLSTTLSGTAIDSSGGGSLFFILSLPLLWLRRHFC